MSIKRRNYKKELEEALVDNANLRRVIKDMLTVAAGQARADVELAKTFEAIVSVLPDEEMRKRKGKVVR